MGFLLQTLDRPWWLQPLLKFPNSFFSRLPMALQNFFRSRLFQKSLGVLLALRLLKSFSNQLAWYSLNNYTRLGSWNPDRELVLITGGSSGIGEQIMRDIARYHVKVVIMDMQEPKSRLRR